MGDDELIYEGQAFHINFKTKTSQMKILRVDDF